MTDRHSIGGNQPPAHEAIGLEVESLFELISDSLDGASVTTDEQDAQLDGLAKDVRALKAKAEESRKAEKEPHLKAGREIDAAYKPVTTRCDAALAEIKALLTPYRVAKQAAKDEAAQRAREEAERIEREAQNVLRSDAPLTERFDADEKLKVAAKQKAVANKIDRSATGLRTRKIVTVTDHRAALNWMLKRAPDDLRAFLDEYARRHAPTRPMDGVEVTEERIAA